MSTRPTAHVVSGPRGLVLVDPDAAALVLTVRDINCREVLRAQIDRVRHFERRIAERGLSAASVLIVLINVDTTYGGPLADSLMPGADWSEVRARGETPFARGIVERDGMQVWLDKTGLPAAAKLRGIDGGAVLVVDHEHAAVFSWAELSA